MRRVAEAAILLVIVCFPAAPLYAQDASMMPLYDMEAQCIGMAADEGGYSALAYQDCMEANIALRAEAATLWPDAPPQTQRHCSAAAAQLGRSHAVLARCLKSWKNLNANPVGNPEE